jgi:hypothetical protein
VFICSGLKPEALHLCGGNHETIRARHHVAFGLTLPAFGQQAVNPEGVYQLNLAKSTIRVNRTAKVKPSITQRMDLL